MKIKNFYIIPESRLDDQFIDEELDYLLEISLHRRNEIKTKEEYEKLVIQRFNSWQLKEISVG